MSTDPATMAGEINDLNLRISQLERLNATLAAEIDRMRQEGTLAEDYYTLAEIRLAVDIEVVEYGSCEARLSGIRGLVDKKRPELKPVHL